MALYDVSTSEKKASPELVAGSRKTNIYRCNSFAEYEALPAAEKAKYDYVATPDGAIGDIKCNVARVPCADYSNNMNLSSYCNASLDSGYEFLCYTHIASNGWIFPTEMGTMYVASPNTINGAPFVKDPTQVPQTDYIDFFYLEVKRI